MDYFNEQNTEGFSTTDLDMLNSAMARILEDGEDDESTIQNVGDMLNNAWHENMSADDLDRVISAIRRRVYGMTETEYKLMVDQLETDARELMSSGEPDLCGSRDGFMNTMWPDDHDMDARGATRDRYQSALDDVYRRLTT